jgi:hypothetical protein
LQKLEKEVNLFFYIGAGLHFDLINGTTEGVVNASGVPQIEITNGCVH